MRSKLILLAGLAAMLAVAPNAAGSTMGPQAYVEVWTSKGEGEIYDRGEGVDIYVESSFDAYVLVYTIDTDGYINVVFPYDCQDDGFLRGGRTYRLVSGDDGFYADGSRGVAYVRALASATPSSERIMRSTPVRIVSRARIAFFSSSPILSFIDPGIASDPTLLAKGRRAPPT